MTMKQIVRKYQSIPQRLWAFGQVMQLKDGVHQVENVVYACQFPSQDRVSEVLDKQMLAGDDPNWKHFGYKTKEEVTYWAPRQCAVSCLKMAFSHYGVDMSEADIADRGLTLGGYDTVRDQGLYYAPLVRVAGEFGIVARMNSYLSNSMIVHEIVRGNLVMASVNPQTIRGDRPASSRRKNGISY